MKDKKNTKKQAETHEKTIWYLLINHANRPLGSLSTLSVQANIYVPTLMKKIKAEHPNNLHSFDVINFDPWTYKDARIPLHPTSHELGVIVRGITFSDASENPKPVSPLKKVADIVLSEDVILLVRILPPPPQTTPTAKEWGPEASLTSIEKSVFCFLLSGIGHLFHFSAHLASVLQAQQAPAPSSVAASPGRYQSEQDNRPIYNGRPPECRGSPVVIYHESLANLKQKLDHLSKEPDPPVDIVGRTAELFHVAAQIYTSEREREPPIIYPLLGALLGVNFKAAVEAYKAKTRQRATVADALFHAEIEDTTFGKKKAVAVYLELENELGVRGDGGLQAALSLRKHITQEDVKSFMMTLNILSLTYSRL